MSIKTENGQPKLPILVMLFLDDFKDVHGTSLNADAASNTLTGGAAFFHDHDLHGTCFHALAAGNAELLIDHVNAGLGILGDGALFAGLFTLSALDAGHRLCTGSLGHDLDAGIIRMEFLVKSIGASLDAFQTSHTFRTLFNHEFLHN